MARTKQTARNSTGGTSVLVNLSSRPLEIGEKAPHPPLPIKHLRSSTVRELATVVALANGASNSKPSALSQIRQASQIRRTRLSAAPLAAGHTVQSPSSQSVDSPGPELPIGNIEDVSTYLLCTSGYLPYFFQWCALCTNGGDVLVGCQKCTRINCSSCVPILADLTPEQLETLNYKCPSCTGRGRVFQVRTLACFD